MGTSQNLQEARNVYYGQCRMADFWVDLKKMPVTELGVLENLPGISEIRDRIAFQVIVELEGVEQPLSGTLLTLPADPSPVVNGILLRSGTYFTPRRQDEVIVSEAFAEARDIHEGDTIHLIMNGQRKSLFVVGTAMSAEYVYMIPPGAIAPEPSRYGVFYVKREFGEDTLGFNGACNSLVGLLSEGSRQNAQPLFDEIRRRLKPYGVFAITPLSLQPSNLSLSGEFVRSCHHLLFHAHHFHAGGGTRPERAHEPAGSAATDHCGDPQSLGLRQQGNLLSLYGVRRLCGRRRGDPGLSF